MGNCFFMIFYLVRIWGVGSWGWVTEIVKIGEPGKVHRDVATN